MTKEQEIRARQAKRKFVAEDDNIDYLLTELDRMRAENADLNNQALADKAAFSFYREQTDTHEKQLEANQRTPGTVEVCELCCINLPDCKVSCRGSNFQQRHCPLKPARGA